MQEWKTRVENTFLIPAEHKERILSGSGVHAEQLGSFFQNYSQIEEQILASVHAEIVHLEKSMLRQKEKEENLLETKRAQESLSSILI